jgi:hypothetical protein
MKMRIDEILSIFTSGREEVKTSPNIAQGFQNYKDGIPGKEFIDRSAAGVIKVIETGIHNLSSPPFKEVKHTVCLTITGYPTSEINTFKD